MQPQVLVLPLCQCLPQRRLTLLICCPDQPHPQGTISQGVCLPPQEHPRQAMHGPTTRPPRMSGTEQGLSHAPPPDANSRRQEPEPLKPHARPERRRARYSPPSSICPMMLYPHLPKRRSPGRRKQPPVSSAVVQPLGSAHQHPAMPPLAGTTLVISPASSATVHSVDRLAARRAQHPQTLSSSGPKA